MSENKLRAKFIIGSKIRGTTRGQRYYKNCDENLLLGEVIEIEKRMKSVMLHTKILEHTNSRMIGKVLNVNQNYMDAYIGNGKLLDVEGNEVLEENSISILGRVYTKNLNAFYVNAKWYSSNSDKIAKDYYTDSYEMKDQLASGIVGKGMKKGLFNVNAPYVRDEVGIIYMDSVTAIKNDKIENKFDGIFYSKSCKVGPKQKIAFSDSYNFGNILSTNELRKLGPKAQNKLKITDLRLGKKSPTFLIPGGFKGTFGIEIETSSGKVPIHIVKEKALNFKCMRDGSIKGGEYVSGIFQGDKGFENLNRMCSELADRCEVDNTCGIHVHIGGVEFDRSFIVFAYMLGLQMEQEIQSTIPVTRRAKTGTDWVKRQCRDLPVVNFNKFHKNRKNMTSDLWEHMINEYYEKIYHILSGGSKPGRQKSSHPGGRWCSQRYLWLNLVPCCFTNAKSDDRNNNSGSYTIEFRNHPGSLNYEKIKNWVLMCMAFVNYVQNNKEQILDNESSLTKIDAMVNSLFNKKRSRNLNAYFDERKAKFTAKSSKGIYKDDMESEEKTLKELTA